jgi:phospholipid/cholesterol/gamma-HCH transport system permease protein
MPDSPSSIPRRSGTARIVRTGDGAVAVAFAGSWRMGSELPPADAILADLAAVERVGEVALTGKELSEWDSMLLVAIRKIEAACKERGARVRRDLPESLCGLLTLSDSHVEEVEATAIDEHDPFVIRVGRAVADVLRSGETFVSFLGSATVAFARFLVGRARFRGSDLALAMQQAGALALPIVSLISVLIGLILAFVGAIQLRQFGVQLYVANLVAIGMLREMGAIMTAIIMAGRTGAAYAAELGTMQVNEELDALQTLGFSPMEFLVLPRMLALVLMMPLLCLYADVLGILGGALIGVTILDLPWVEYWNQTLNAMTLNNFLIGVIKSSVFGVIIALAGCLKGMTSGRSAASVGLATTSAVVVAIVLIVAVDGLFAVVLNLLGL